ncbi:MAG: FHA domain-containing protein [Aggregatilineales bacterium]
MGTVISMRIRLTLSSPLFGPQSEQTVAIRTDVRIEDLSAEIRAEFQLSDDIGYGLRMDDGRLLPNNQTLEAAGIREGSRLQFVSLGKKQAVLQTQNGQRFELRKRKTIIGRASGSSEPPDIDLDPFDPGKYSSRPQTEITKEKDSYYAINCRVENPTYINNHPIEGKEPYLLRSGDQLRFGKHSAAATFTFALVSTGS